MAACTEVLKVNRDLLDSEFDGYKLSLDPLPIYSLLIKSGVDEVKLRDDEYTFQHMQAFGLTNYLTGDLWNPNCVYYVDTEWRLLQLRVVLESQLTEPTVVFTIPEGATRRAGSRHSVSLSFPSPHLCVLSDGVGLLYVLDTGVRDQFECTQWKVVFKREVCGGAPAILQHGVCREEDSEIRVDCLLLHVEKSCHVNEENGEGSTAKTNKSDYETNMEWITLKKTVDQAEFEVENTRELRGKTAPVYCGLEEGAQGLFVASEADFVIISDSLYPVKAEVNDETEKEEEETPLPLFTWTQTGEDVILTFIVPETVSKPDIHMVMEADRIDISIKNSKELLSGALYRLVDIACCTWTLEKRKLDVMLAKENEGFMWTEVVVGNTRGEYVADPDQARLIHERLAHLTSDALGPDPSGNIGGQPGISPQDLEECDMNVENEVCIYRIDGHKHTISHKDRWTQTHHLTQGKYIGGQPGISPQDLEECDMNVENEVCIYRIDGHKHTISHKTCISSYQRIFKAPLQPSHPPCICLRHDVDGVIWQPRPTTAESPSPWQHEATFNALGYVQASKRNCKFASCSPDTSYCVLCDCSKHGYIYRQPADIPSPLRNRKSGRVVGQIAKQQVISLDAIDDILGLQATNERLFILTTKKMYVIRINVD